ncbi:MAG: DUF3343 domain-containing protein [Clostridiaceae bacterium]|nr:DUF3343 domain-containing protein [Clostridiaceae bacterium]
MNREKIYVIVFDSTHYAIAAEKNLKDKGYKFNMIPTPREITANCGLSIMFNEDILGYIKKDVESKNLKVKGIYEMEKTLHEKKVTQIG